MPCFSRFTQRFQFDSPASLVKMTFLLFTVITSSPSYANIQTINAIATGVATTTQVLARSGDSYNTGQPVGVQPQIIQPIATATEASQSPAKQQPVTNLSESSNAATPQNTEPSSASPPAEPTQAPLEDASNLKSDSSSKVPPPDANQTQAVEKPQMQSIVGVYAFGLTSEHELKVKVVIDPKSLGEGKTDLVQALEGITAMVCVDKACQYAFPNKEGYFESVLELPSRIKENEPQTHTVPITAVACSSLGCVKSKLDTEVKFGT